MLFSWKVDYVRFRLFFAEGLFYCRAFKQIDIKLVLEDKLHINRQNSIFSQKSVNFSTKVTDGLLSVIFKTVQSKHRLQEAPHVLPLRDPMPLPQPVFRIELPVHVAHHMSQVRPLECHRLLLWLVS